MREFNRLMEYREYYIYDTDNEVFCIATGPKHNEALELYTQIADRYFILEDFRSYADAQKKINQFYQQRDSWTKSATLNMANVGKFSSDRTIQEYVDDIWKLDKITVNTSGM